MKKLYSILTTVLITASVFAQAPEKMSYQAVIRDAGNTLVTSQAVGMQINILQGSVSGTAVYVETQTPTTNINGLVSIEIGAGAIVSGAFNTIDWSTGPYFIKTETDPIGGTTYTITGTSQLMSVPYALHAKTAESVTGGITETDPVYIVSEAANITANDITVLSNTSGTNTGDQSISRTGTTVTLTNGGTFTDSVNTYTAGTNITISASNVISASSSAGTHYLGEEFGGGVIYHLYIGSDGNQHGLIVNKTESTASWQTTTITTNATRSWDGAYNTGLMTGSPAATYVNGLTDGGFSDWYLPSIDELRRLYANRDFANKALNAIGGATLLSNTANYWSSTESNSANAFRFYFYGGYADNNGKPSALSVRAVRAF